MAEYIEVIKQFKRLCKSINPAKCTRGECPMKCENIGQCRKIAFEQPAHFADTVMRWAAEHPEPLYPVWRDWLRDLYGNPNMTMTDILESPIDPEIALRLNIIPKKVR
jgi:hypothetical protein